MAAKKKAKKKAVGAVRRAKPKTVVVTKTTRHKSVGRIGKNTLMDVVQLGVGMAVSTTLRQMLVTPLEGKIPQQARAFLPAGEALVGGMLLLKGNNKLLQGVGAGLMVNAVTTVVRRVMPQSPILQQPVVVTPAADAKVGAYGDMFLPMGATAYSDLDNVVGGILQEKYLTASIAGVNTMDYFI